MSNRSLFSESGPDPWSSDTDSISVTSTVESNEEGKIYDVEKILDETTDENGINQYLLQWENYPLHMATWQTEEDLVNGMEDLLCHWQERKIRIARGFTPQFDFESWEEEQQRLREAKDNRKARRRAKRARLGLPLSSRRAEEPNDNDNPILPEIADSSDAEPSDVVRPTLSAPPTTHSEHDLSDFVVPDDVVDDDNEREFIPSLKRRYSGSSSSSSSSSDVPLVEQLKAAKSKADIRRKRSKFNTAVGNLDIASPNKPQKPQTNNITAIIPAPRRKQPGQEPIQMRRVTAEPSRVQGTSIVSVVTKKLGRTTAVRTTNRKHGAEIFANWGRAGKQKLHKPIDPTATHLSSRQTYLQNQRRCEMRGRDEPVPRFEDVQRLNGDTVNIPKTRNSEVDELFIEAQAGAPPTPAESISPVGNREDEASGTTGGKPAKELRLPNFGRFNPKPRPEERSALSAAEEQQAWADAEVTSTETRRQRPEIIASVSNVYSMRPRQASPQRDRAAKSLRELQDGSSNKLRHGTTQGTLPVGPQSGMKIPLTCPNWHWTNCHFSDADCPFLHRDIGPDNVAPKELLDQMRRTNPPLKFSRPDGHGLTCWFWWNNGNCIKDMIDCAFAHWNTGLVASKGIYAPPVPVQLDPLSLPSAPMSPREYAPPLGRLSDTTKDQIVESIEMPTGPKSFGEHAFQRPRCRMFFASKRCSHGDACYFSHEDHGQTWNDDKKNVTCFFWYSRGGRCSKGDDVCPYAHRVTDVMGPPPPNYHPNKDIFTPWIVEGKSLAKAPAAPSPPVQRSPPPDSPSPPRPRPSPPRLGRPAQIDTTVTRSDTRTRGAAPTLTSANLVTPITAQTVTPTSVQVMTPASETAAGSRKSSVVVPHVTFSAGLQLPGRNEIFKVQLSCLNGPSKDRLRDALGEARLIKVEYVRDPHQQRLFSQQNEDDVAVVGDLAPVDPNFATHLTDYVEGLKLDAVGGVAILGNHAMLVYPIGQDYWNFLNQGIAPSNGAYLRFYLSARLIEPVVNDIMKSLENAEAVNSAITEKSQKSGLVLGRERKEIEELFRAPTGLMMEKHVFLLLRSQEQMDGVASEFLKVRAKTYRANMNGAWDFFIKKVNQGVLLVDPSIKLSQIPFLSFVLGRTTNIFEPVYDMEAKSYSFHRLFPHGSLLLITDEMWSYRPESVLRILEYLLAKNSPTWKLVTRPDILDWLIEIIAGYGDKKSARKDIHIKLYDKLVGKVATAQSTDRDKYDNVDDSITKDPDEPPGSPGEVSADPVKNPGPLVIQAPSWELPGYSESWQTDERKANDELVEWFSFFATQSVYDFRRFIVVHPDVEMVDWKKRYSMMDCVTPEKYEGKYVGKKK